MNNTNSSRSMRKRSPRREGDALPQLEASVARTSPPRLLKDDDVGVLDRVKSDLAETLRDAESLSEIAEQTEAEVAAEAGEFSSAINGAIAPLGQDPAAAAIRATANGTLAAHGIASGAAAMSRLAIDRFALVASLGQAVQRTAGVVRNVAYTMQQRGHVSRGIAEDLKRGLWYPSVEGNPIDVRAIGLNKAMID